MSRRNFPVGSIAAALFVMLFVVLAMGATTMMQDAQYATPRQIALDLPPLPGLPENDLPG